MRLLLIGIVAFVVSLKARVNAGTILIDINRTGMGSTATAAEFTVAGVAEYLT